jgi:hypothetical protein
LLLLPLAHLAASPVLLQVRTVQQSPALQVLGSAWVERQKDFVEQYGAAYHDLCWTPLVRILKVGAACVCWFLT